MNTNGFRRNKSILPDNLLVAVLILFLPMISISANAGTPVMFAGIVHFFILNFFIGLMEGFWARATLQGAGIDRSAIDIYLRLICANYFSAFVGLVLVMYLTVPLDISAIQGSAEWQGRSKFLKELGVIFGVMYPISVLCEFPFISVLSKKRSASYWFDLKLSAKFNLLSNILLFAFYYAMQMSVIK